jgi:hypothetical protein
MSYPGSEEVRERAYRIWESEGKPHGRDLEHWLQAERELSADTGSPTGEKKKRSGGTAPKGRGASSRPRTRKVTN